MVLIGNSFDLQTLAIVSEKSQKETALCLHSAMSSARTSSYAEGLILPLGDAYKMIELDVSTPGEQLKVEYKFAHDRIQQAAYSLIPPEQKQAVHRPIRFS